MRKRLYICKNKNNRQEMAKSTINDIAKALNITPSTVSRALSGNTRVSAHTRKLIEEKAAELGYERNLLASSLRKGTTDTVGMIVPRINRQFFSNAISGAEAILNPAGYNLIIVQSHERKDDERRAIQTLMRNQVAGIIISHSLETLTPDSFTDILEAGIPLVQFDRIFPSVKGAFVSNDNFSGAYLATKHLIKNGYKHIGHLGGDTQSNVYSDRLAGFRSALADADMQVDEKLIFTDCITRDKGFYYMAKALESNCDALYCAGDYAALGVIEYARHNNIRIPEDFGVVGTANETFAEVVTPALTTLEQNAFDMGNRAAQAFLNIKSSKVENGEKALAINVPMRLIIRESSIRQQDK